MLKMVLLNNDIIHQYGKIISDLTSHHVNKQLIVIKQQFNHIQLNRIYLLLSFPIKSNIGMQGN